MKAIISIALPIWTNHKWLALVGAPIILMAMASPVRADVIYNFNTLTATVDGAASSILTAFGQIVLSSAGVAAGGGSVTTSPNTGPPSETLNGVTGAYFGFNFGVPIGSSDGVINFVATVNGTALDITPDNSYGGFFVNAADTEAYFAVDDPGTGVLTIGYGSDNPNSPCFGPQLPSSSRCVVTGEFVDPPSDSVPEPSSLAILVASLGCLAAPLWRRRRAAMQYSDGAD